MLYSTVIYISVLAISLLLLKKVYSDKKTLLNLLICFIPLILISGLRYGIGTDYFSYVDISYDVFNRFDLTLVFSHFEEPLNVLIYNFAYSIFNDPTAVFFIYAILTHFFIALTMYELKDDINEYVFLFIYVITLYFLSFNIIRQMLAISITLFGCAKLSKKEYKFFFLLILLAMMIHKSSVAVIVIYFIKIFYEQTNPKYRDKTFFILTIISVIAIMFLCPILPNILKLFGINSKYFNMHGKIQFNFLLYIMPNILFLSFYRNKNYLSNNYDILYYSYFLQIPIQCLGIYYNFVDRFFVPFMALHCILYSNIFNNLDNKYSKSFGFVFLWFLFYFIVMFILMNSNGVFPYKFVFFK